MKSLRNTLLGSATLLRILGASDATEATARIHDRFANDEPVSDSDDTPQDSYPRCIISDDYQQTTQIDGNTSFWGTGTLAAFVEFEQFSDAELTTWYSQTITGATDRDHMSHAKNVSLKIAKEIRDLKNPAGSLTVRRLTEHPPFRTDHVTVNNRDIWVVPFEFDWEGLPQ